MEEAVVIGILLFSCALLGLTMLDGEGLRKAEARVGVAQPATSDSLWQFKQDAEKDRRGLHLSLQAYQRGDRAIEAIDAPRILARREVLHDQGQCAELSSDVIDRYRCFADDLARLRKEKLRVPATGTNKGKHSHSASFRWSGATKGRSAPPIGSAYAHGQLPAPMRQMPRDQLPLAESVSTRV